MYFLVYNYFTETSQSWFPGQEVRTDSSEIPDTS
jgi:hypothetical protein